ncbi:MAG: lipid-A-disaccharide synthase [Gemmatimonadales bacterium]
MNPRILVLAGEPSGDLHGGRVVTALRERFPDATIDAVGGPRMAAAGATIRRSIDGLSAMGLVEILDKLPAHIRLLRSLRRDFVNRRYDLVIPIDYPGFHLRVAESAKRAGIKVLWYIAPQIWAWRPQRADRFSRAVDRLAVILPFEPGFFGRVGIATDYVGHPLVDGEALPSREAARAALGIPDEARVLALFPGSRHGEIRRLWPAYRDAARQVLAAGGCTHVIVAATADGDYPDAGEFTLVADRGEQVLAAADAVLAKSGTTTLEAALADVPMVVAYRLNPLTFVMLRRLVTVRWASLVNLVAEQEVVPELMQGAVTAEALARAVLPLLDPTGDAARTQRRGLAEVRRRLGGPGASERLAALAGQMLVA